MELTEQIVENARYEGASYVSKSGRKRWTRHVLWDDRVAGLGLKISSTQRKTFVVAYRVGGRKRTRTLGRVGELTLAQARERAAAVVAADGEEPASPAPEDALEGVETVADLASAYLERHLKVNAPTWFAEQRLIRTYVVPMLGRARLAEVTPMDLSSFRAQAARKFPSEARKLSALVNDMFEWAEAQAGAPGPSPAPAVTGPPPARPEEGPNDQTLPAAELADALKESEQRCRELERQLEGVSEGGAAMMEQLNEAAAARRQLESDLQRARKDLRRARRGSERGASSRELERDKARLQASVEQLMESLKESEAARQELAAGLGGAPEREESLLRQVQSLREERSALEARLQETVRRRAAAPALHGGGGSWRRRLPWAAGGAVLGVVVLLSLQALPGGAGSGRPAPPAEPAAGAPAPDPPPPAADPLPTPEPPAVAEPAPPSGDPQGLAIRPAGPPAVAAEPPAPSPEQAAPEPAGASAGPDPVERPAEAGPDLAAVAATVDAWADAWSGQRVDEYLSFYAPAFRPPGGQGRARWESQRRERILRPASIRLTLGPIRRTELGPGRIRVTFSQAYATESYRDEVTKTLELVWEDGAWKITREASD